MIRLCARAGSSQGIFIFFEVNLKKKLLVCTLICSYCLFFPAPHAPDLVINFFKPSSAFIGLSLQSRKRSHTHPDKTILMSLNPGAISLVELILQLKALSQLLGIISNGPWLWPPAEQPLSIYDFQIVGSGASVKLLQKKKLYFNCISGLKKITALQYLLLCTNGEGTAHNIVAITKVKRCSLLRPFYGTGKQSFRTHNEHDRLPFGWGRNLSLPAKVF